MRVVLFILSLFLFLNAHQYHESYINIDYNKTTPSLQWEIEGDNLNLLFNLDDNGNSIVSWKELNNHKDDILKYSQKYIKLTFDNQNLPLEFQNYHLKRYDDQTYIVVNIPIPQSLPKKIDIEYSLFFKMDSLQKCFVKVYDKNSTKVHILSPLVEKISINMQKETLFDNLREFFIDGIWHILVGIDHILFLLMLILPSVKNQTNFKKVLIEITKIVTAFSIAHSITLILSALDIISISSKFIDVMIAISVLLTALNNIVEKIKGFSWQIAFAFGLIHGFGFANAIGKLELSSDFFIYFVAIFNLGIEFGQLLLVIVILPLLFIVKDTDIYKKLILKVGSLITLLIAVYWIFVRV